MPKCTVMALVIAMIGGLATVAKCPADDPSFREFPQQEVPTPEQLVRILGGVNVPPPSVGPNDSAELAAFAESLLSDMSPESREQLSQWATELLGGQSSNATPQQMQRSAELLRQRMEENPALTRDLVDRIQNEVQSRGGRLPDGLVRPGAGPGRSNTNPRNRTGNQNLEIEDLNTESLRQLFERLRSQAGPSPGAPPGRGGPTRPGRSAAPGRSTAPSRSATGGRSSIQPPRGPATGPATPGNPITSSRQFRDRLNRILMDAARESSGQLTLPDESNPSQLSESMNSALNRFVNTARDKLNDRDPHWQRRVNRRLNTSSRRMRRSAQGSSVNRWMNSGETLADTIAGGPQNNPRMMIGLAVVFAIAIAAFVWRRPLQRQIQKYLGSVSQSLGFRFRLGAIKAPTDLIRATDRYLLWQFGKTSDWWHSRIVEQTLCSDYPQMATEITALVSSYERARYAPQSGQITTDQISESANTLRQLVELRVDETRA